MKPFLLQQWQIEAVRARRLSLVIEPFRASAFSTKLRHGQVMWLGVHDGRIRADVKCGAHNNRVIHYPHGLVGEIVPVKDTEERPVLIDQSAPKFKIVSVGWRTLSTIMEGEAKRTGIEPKIERDGYPADSRTIKRGICSEPHRTALASDWDARFRPDDQFATGPLVWVTEVEVVL